MIKSRGWHGIILRHEHVRYDRKDNLSLDRGITCQQQRVTVDTDRIEHVLFHTPL